MRTTSPVSLSHSDHEKENTASPTLENMLDQLVQATSDWDESLFVDDKFKHLIIDASKKEKVDPLTSTLPLGATQCEPSNASSHGDDSSSDHGIHSLPNPLLNSPYALRDRTRDLLFSIPEEESISFSDVVIQTY